MLRDRQPFAVWHHSKDEEERVPLRATARRRRRSRLVVIAPWNLCMYGIQPEDACTTCDLTFTSP